MLFLADLWLLSDACCLASCRLFLHMMACGSSVVVTAKLGRIKPEPNQTRTSSQANLVGTFTAHMHSKGASTQTSNRQQKEPHNKQPSNQANNKHSPTCQTSKSWAPPCLQPRLGRPSTGRGCSEAFGAWKEMTGNRRPKKASPSVRLSKDKRE